MNAHGAMTRVNEGHKGWQNFMKPFNVSSTSTKIANRQASMQLKNDFH